MKSLPVYLMDVEGRRHLPFRLDGGLGGLGGNPSALQSVLQVLSSTCQMTNGIVTVPPGNGFRKGIPFAR